MALDTVGDFITRARVLLQDEVAPYRYETDELIASLNEAHLEAKRLRPDLYLRTFEQDLPDYTVEGDSVEDTIPPEFRRAFLYYIVGDAQLRDDEATQDARATIFLNKFVAQLLTLPS